MSRDSVTTTRDDDGNVVTVTKAADGTTTIVSKDEDGRVSKTVKASDGKVIVAKSGEGVAVATLGDDRYVGFDSHHGWRPDLPWWMFLVVFLSIVGVIKTAIRARAGDTRTSREIRADARARRAGLASATGVSPSREAELLAKENASLKGQLVRMEERVRVLERIVTDPAKRVADEIDSLR